MPKAVLSNRIYLETTPEMRAALDKELTYHIPGYRDDEPSTVIKNMAPFRKNIVSIPSGREDLIPEDYEVIDRRTVKEAEFPDFTGELRPSQQAIWDEIEDSCIINAWVSFGKTFTALAIAGKLGQKTLVIAHTIALRNQWVREVEKVYGFTPDIIGSGKFSIKTPIVIGNVQTLYNRIADVYNQFGLIILDEMHHCSAPTFSRIIDKSCAKYKIGLSGTIERKDLKHVVFRDYFGHKIFKPPAENFMEPKVHVYRSVARLPDAGYLPWAKKINMLAYNEDYQHSIALIASKYAAKGHSVLVVSDRVKFLQNCAQLIGSNAICITGEVKCENEREVLMQKITDGKKNVLCGTQSIFSEGISLNSLSCIILATPINNEPLLTQLVGRILRKQEGKLQPIVVDINLLGKTASNQAQQRMGFYIGKGWEIEVL